MELSEKQRTSIRAWLDRAAHNRQGAAIVVDPVELLFAMRIFRDCYEGGPPPILALIDKTNSQVEDWIKQLAQTLFTADAVLQLSTQFSQLDQTCQLLVFHCVGGRTPDFQRILAIIDAQPDVPEVYTGSPLRRLLAPTHEGN